MYHTAIVRAVLDSPGDFEAGISGVVLDESHTMVIASDESDAITENEFDDFVAEYQTVEDHPRAGDVAAEIRASDGQIKDNY